MTADNNTNARNQNVHIAHIKIDGKTSFGGISNIVCDLRMAHAEIDCDKLMTDLCAEIYGAEEDVQAIVDVLNNSAYADKMFVTVLVTAEAKEIELDEGVRKEIAHFRDKLKASARLSGGSETFVNKYSTADLVRYLIHIGVNDYQHSLDELKAHKEGQ